MAKPSQKSEGIEKFLEDVFGRSTAIKSDTCSMCKGEAKEFNDPLSQKEYSISGMCQKCQDLVFGA